MTLDGPSQEADCYIERFDGLDLTHVSSLFNQRHSIFLTGREACNLIVTEWGKALDDLSPF